MHASRTPLCFAQGFNLQICKSTNLQINYKCPNDLIIKTFRYLFAYLNNLLICLLRSSAERIGVANG